MYEPPVAGGDGPPPATGGSYKDYDDDDDDVDEDDLESVDEREQAGSPTWEGMFEASACCAAARNAVREAQEYGLPAPERKEARGGRHSRDDA